MNTEIRKRINLCFAALVFLMLSISQILAQAETPLEPSNNNNEWAWNFTIALIVLIFTFASAALPLAAMKQWRGRWTIAAAFPLGVLAIWIVVIILTKLNSVDSHRLWPFEIFAWAMINMVYMVSVMTIKRILDKDSTSN